MKLKVSGVSVQVSGVNAAAGRNKPISGVNAAAGRNKPIYHSNFSVFRSRLQRDSLVLKPIKRSVIIIRRSTCPQCL